jgi:hypothetical protein
MPGEVSSVASQNVGSHTISWGRKVGKCRIFEISRISHFFIVETWLLLAGMVGSQTMPIHKRVNREREKGVLLDDWVGKVLWSIDPTSHYIELMFDCQAGICAGRHALNQGGSTA